MSRIGHQPLLNSSGSLAIFAAIRRASLRVSGFAADRRPGAATLYRKKELCDLPFPTNAA